MDLFLQENYDREFVSKVYQSPLVNYQDLKDGKVEGSPVRILYRTKEEYKLIAKKLGLMDDFKVKSKIFRD